MHRKEFMVRTIHTPALALVLGLAIALVASACTVGAGSGTDAEGSTIGFVTPSDGATVSIPFDVEIEADEPLGDPSTGNRHAHLYFDTSTDAADYDIVYGTSWQVTRPLEPGEHTIIVALANPDHSLAGPTQEIRVTIGDSGGGESEGGGVTTAPPPIDY